MLISHTLSSLSKTFLIKRKRSKFASRSQATIVLHHFNFISNHQMVLSRKAVGFIVIVCKLLSFVSSPPYALQQAIINLPTITYKYNYIQINLLNKYTGICGGS